MSDNPYEHFDLNGSSYRVKELGLAEILSMAVTFYQKKLRKDLKEGASGYGFNGKERVDYIIESEKNFPKGEELTTQSTDYLFSEDGNRLLCAYALDRFNNQIEGLDAALVLYDKFDVDDKVLMGLAVIRSFTAEAKDVLDDLDKEDEDGKKPEEVEIEQA